MWFISLHQKYEVNLKFMKAIKFLNLSSFCIQSARKIIANGQCGLSKKCGANCFKLRNLVRQKHLEQKREMKFHFVGGLVLILPSLSSFCHPSCPIMKSQFSSFIAHGMWECKKSLNYTPGLTA